MSEFISHLALILENANRNNSVSLDDKIKIINIMLKDYTPSSEEMILLQTDAEAALSENSTLIYLCLTLNLFQLKQV